VTISTAPAKPTRRTVELNLGDDISEPQSNKILE